MTTPETLPANRTATAESKPSKIDMGDMGLKFANLEDAFRFAKYVSVSGLAPKGMEKPETILVAMQSGMELGFSAMQALQSMTVINGKSSIYGDAAMALIRSKKCFKDKIEKWEGTIKDGTRKVTITLVRDGQTPISRSFSIEDAKRASLWGKSGPWSQYPERMLGYRALAFAMRDGFSDILKGVAITEEDYSAKKEKNITPEVQISDPRAMQLLESETTGNDRNASFIDVGSAERQDAPNDVKLTSQEPENSGETKDGSTTAPQSTSPAHSFDRAEIIKAIQPLIDKAKPAKLEKIANSTGIEWEQFYEVWTESTEEQLKSLLSLLKC